MRAQLSLLLALFFIASFISLGSLAPVPENPSTTAAVVPAAAGTASPPAAGADAVKPDAPATPGEAPAAPADAKKEDGKKTEAPADAAGGKKEKPSAFKKTFDKIKAKFRELTGDSSSQNTTTALVLLSLTSAAFSLL